MCTRWSAVSARSLLIKLSMRAVSDMHLVHQRYVAAHSSGRPAVTPLARLTAPAASTFGSNRAVDRTPVCHLSRNIETQDREPTDGLKE